MHVGEQTAKSENVPAVSAETGVEAEIVTPSNGVMIKAYGEEISSDLLSTPGTDSTAGEASHQASHQEDTNGLKMQDWFKELSDQDQMAVTAFYDENFMFACASIAKAVEVEAGGVYSTGHCNVTHISRKQGRLWR